MSPEAWIVVLAVAFGIAVVAAVIFLVDMIRADEALDAARAELANALAAKSVHFEESQRQIAALRTELDHATDLGISSQRTIDGLVAEIADIKAERDGTFLALSPKLRAAEAELADLKRELAEAKAGPFKGGGAAAIIPAESDPEELFVYVQARDDFSARVRAERVARRLEAGLRAEKAEAELALLRPIADAAEKLLDGNNLPGEFSALREAIRARKEAQS